MIQIEDNDSPITAAQKIIHGTKAAPWTPASKLGYVLATGEAPKEKECELDMFSYEEIREIAAYLLTYCKYHGEEND